jgi:hypothetical protein
LRHNPDAAEIFMALSGVGNGLYEYKKRGAKIDFRTAVELATGKEVNLNLSNYRMASASNKEIDADVYAVLFRHLSQSVHPNVDTLHRYFSEEEGFAIHVETNPFEGLIIFSFVVVLLFAELAQLQFFKKIQRRDAGFEAKKMANLISALNSGGLEIFPGTFGCLKDKLKDAVMEAKSARG